VVTTLDKRAFAEKVDFITSPGDRVTRVITDQCIFDRDPDRGELVLSALFADVTEADVRSQVGWKLCAASSVDVVAPPSDEMLAALRSLPR
jgi:glutaconate CoA-transferase subunit A